MVRGVCGWGMRPAAARISKESSKRRHDGHDRFSRRVGQESAGTRAGAVLGAADPAGAQLTAAIAEWLGAAGANPYLSLPDALTTAFRGPGETFGRPAYPASSLAETDRLDGIVFDATGVDSPKGLRGLYDFFHPMV